MKNHVRVLRKSHWTCIWPTKSGWQSQFFLLPTITFVVDFVFDDLRTLLSVMPPKQNRSTQTCPLEGQFLYLIQLNIDANNAGTVLPLPGNRARVARSVERDAVWWIGFSWSSKCKILPPVEEQDFQQQSHAIGLDHAQFCQLSVLTAIFLVRLLERTGAVKRKKVTHSSSRRCWAEVCTCLTSCCLCSLCTFSSWFVNPCKCILSLSLNTCHFLTFLAAYVCSSSVCTCMFMWSLSV